MPGPFDYAPSHIFPTEVSVVMPAASGIYIIVFCKIDAIGATAKFARDVRRVIDSGQIWGIVPAQGPTIGLQNSAGAPPRPSDIENHHSAGARRNWV